jgi:hypothetical protein
MIRCSNFMIDSMRNVKAPLLIFGIYFYTKKLTGEGITEIRLVLDSHPWVFTLHINNAY